MRSFSVVVLLALALILATFAPVASAWANATAYSDAQCTTAIGEPATFPFSSSSKCVDTSSPTSASSLVFYCSNSGGYTSLNITAWQSVSDCSSGDYAALASNGTTGSCAPLSIVVVQGGVSTSYSAYAHILCSDSVTASVDEASEASQLGDMVRALQATAKRTSTAKTSVFRHGKLSRK